jgi:hypothetical protein
MRPRVISGAACAQAGGGGGGRSGVYERREQREAGGRMRGERGFGCGAGAWWAKCRGRRVAGVVGSCANQLDSDRIGVGACFLSVGHRVILKFLAIQCNNKLFGLAGRNLPAVEWLNWHRFTWPPRQQRQQCRLFWPTKRTPEKFDRHEASFRPSK